MSHVSDFLLSPEQELMSIISKLEKQLEFNSRGETTIDLTSKNWNQLIGQDKLNETANCISRLIDLRNIIFYNDLRSQIFILKPIDWIKLVKSESITFAHPEKIHRALTIYLHERVLEYYDYIPIIESFANKEKVRISKYKVLEYTDLISDLDFDNIARCVEEDEQKELEETFPGILKKDNININKPNLIRYSFKELQKRKILKISDNDMDSFINSFGVLFDKHKGLYKTNSHFINAVVKFHDSKQTSIYLRNVLALWVKYRCIDGYKTDISMVFSELFSRFELRGLKYDSVRNNLKPITVEDNSTEESFKSELALALKSKQ